MRSRLSWPSLVGTVESQLRQIRALSTYQFDAKRIGTLAVPTLLLTGSETLSPELKSATRALNGLFT
jgi:hypothetical protein